MTPEMTDEEFEAFMKGLERAIQEGEFDRHRFRFRVAAGKETIYDHVDPDPYDPDGPYAKWDKPDKL